MTTLNILLHMVAPRAVLVILVMISTLSICVRHYTIEAINLKGVSRRRSRTYGNFMGLAVAIFTFPASIQLAAASTGSL